MKRKSELFERIKEGIDATPVIDLHCHIRVDRPNARNLAEIIFYHFLSIELVASGVDVRSELPSFVNSLPENNEGIRRIVAKYIVRFNNIRNTTTYWCLKKILRDLYQFDLDRINSTNWEPLYDRVLSTASDDKWTEEIFSKYAKVKVIVPTVGDLEKFEKTDKRWIEKGIISPTFEGDILNHIKGDLLAGDSIRKALRKFLQRCKSLGIMSLTGGKISEFAKITEAEAERLRDKLMVNKWFATHLLPPEELNKFSNIVLETANDLEHPWIMAFGIGLPFKGKDGQNLVMINHNEIPQLCKALNEYKKIKVFIYAPAFPQSQEICTAARMIPNIYPLGFQWHGFFFPYIERVIEERLAVLPINKTIGFMSDAYSAEWFYGKLCVVIYLLARVLSRNVEEGLYTEEFALEIARKWLHDNPKEIYFGKLT